MKRFSVGFLLLLLAVLAPGATLSSAQTVGPSAPAPAQLSISLGGEDGSPDLGVSIQMLFLMTLLTLGPSVVVMMSSFTRIVIVLGFVRTALGVQQAPSNQIIIGLGLILTFFIMQPVLDQINNEALQPYFAKEMTSTEAVAVGAAPLKQFMMKQTRVSDIEFFLELSGQGPTSASELPLRIVVPSFVMSEIPGAWAPAFGDP